MIAAKVNKQHLKWSI